MAADLLGMRFQHGSRNYQTHIGARFIWIDRLHLQGDHAGRDAEILKLYFMFKNLSDLRRTHPQAYTKSRKSIRKAPNDLQYFGARMETYVAASLARAEENFKCRESPDFEITTGNEKIYIECGSANITGNATDPIKKISLSVKAKCNKNYSNRNTALFFDITNVISKCLGNEPKNPSMALRSSINSVIESNGYGSVLLLTYGINENINEIFTNYIRIDSPDISRELLNFMNRNYGYINTPSPINFYPDQG